VDDDETDMSSLRERRVHVADDDWVFEKAMAEAMQRRRKDIREREKSGFYFLVVARTNVRQDP